jgi:TCP-1/cpn60 chaperonin family
MKAKVEAIASHGITCFVNRQLIYNYPESLLSEKGIMCIEHADFEGVERLSLVTGGEIASTFDRPDLVKLGQCDLIEEIMIGEDKVCQILPLRPNVLSRHVLTTVCDIAYQVLGRCSWSSVHSCVARVDESNGGRGRALLARRPFCPFTDCEGNPDSAGWRLLRNAHEQCSRRGSKESIWQEGYCGRGFRKGFTTS